MAAKTLNSDSKLNIYASFNLSADDVNTLSLLYAPLIGSDAFLLYMGIASMLDRSCLGNENLIHQDLLEAFSMNLTQFKKARTKLEGIGLLNVYVNENDEYTYVLIPPYSAKNFFLDSPLVYYLKSKLSDNTFEMIHKHFIIDSIDKNGLTNITKSFDEVFDSDIYTDETTKKFGYILGKNASKIKIKESTFDFDKFVKDIDTGYLKAGVTDEFKQQIIQIAYVYQMDADDMASIYIDSIDRRNEFSIKLLKKKAALLFQTKRNLNAPKLLIKDSNNKSMNQIDFLDYATPVQILDTLSPNYPVSYLDTINELYSNINLPRGVINCMICKVLRDKDGELPGIKYFEKVSETWIADNVLSTEDAIKYVTTIKETKSTHTKSKLKDNPIDEENGGFNIL